MHRTELRTKCERWAKPIVVIALSAGVLVACGRGAGVAVRAGGRVAPTPPAPAAPVSVFQGELRSIDVQAGEIVVAAHLEWAPVTGPLAEDRRVVIGPAVAWQPPDARLATVQAGQEVQVTATSGPDGTWVAREVQLIDVD